MRRFLKILLLLTAPAARADVTYREVIRPLFQNACLNCHNPDKRKAGLDLSTYDATMDGSDNGKVVENGKPDQSVLYKVLSHAAEPYMPKGNDRLSDAQLEQIRQWIAANAPEKPGGAVAKQESGPAVAAAAVEEKPKGSPPMPRDLPLEPVTHTARAGAVQSLAGSPWGPLVALAGQKQVLLYDTDTLELAGVLPFPEGFPAVVRFSHNGSLLIAGGGIGAKLGLVVIWEVATGRRVAVVGDEFDTVLAADISPDQSLVALGGPGRVVKIFSAADGHMVCKMKKHTDWVTALCFTPDGKQLISADRAGGVAVWDCQGHEIESFSAHAAAVTAIACRGAFVATSGEDGKVKLWDINEGKENASWTAHPGGVRSVAFTPAGQLVTAGRDRFVRLWNTGGQQLRQFDPLGDIAMQAAGAGDKIIGADWSGVVRAWTIDGKPAGQLDANPPRIADRIVGLDTHLQDLKKAATVKRAAVDAAARALANARRLAAEGQRRLDRRTAALAAARADAAALSGRLATLKFTLQAAIAERDRAKIDGVRGAWIAAIANPSLEGLAWGALAVRDSSIKVADDLRASVEKTAASLDASKREMDSLPSTINGQTREEQALAAAVQPAASALASARSVADKGQVDIACAEAQLVKWRAAAARSIPQYVQRKP